MSDRPPIPECSLTCYWNTVQAFRKSLPSGPGEKAGPTDDSDAESLQRLIDLQILLRDPAVDRGVEMGLSPIEASRMIGAVERACDDLWKTVISGKDEATCQERLDEALVMLRDVLRVAGSRSVSPPVELIPGGFVYRNKKRDLTGRPWNILAALLKAPYSRRTAMDLRRDLEIDDQFVSFPEQVIRDAAKDLRAALRAAVEEEGLGCDDPLPSGGRGLDLYYELALP